MSIWIERLTNEIAAGASRPDPPKITGVAGIEVVKRSEMLTMVDSGIISEPVLPVFNRITDMIEASLKKLPEKVYCDIFDSGICLTGGGACIEGMDRLIAAKTGMTVRIAPDPLHAVINGATQTLRFWNGKKCWWDNIVWPGIPTWSDVALCENGKTLMLLGDARETAAHLISLLTPS